MKYKLISVFSIAAILGGCTQPAVDLAAEEAALRAAAEAYHAAGESGNFTVMAGFYTSNAIIMPPDDTEKEGPSDVQEFFASSGDIPGLSLRFGEMKVGVAASGDMGYTLADTVISMEGPDGKLVSNDERDLHVWRKEGGEWKIALDMWNAEGAPAAPAPTTTSEDAIVADPEHYAVEFENDRVRIIRIKYGPGEKSVMHTHGPNAAIFLTDGNVRMTYPDGRSEEYPAEFGVTAWEDGSEHLPENLTDEDLEVVLVELK